ncbi:hypothetical protein [uncultured Hydrogenophaga sp.]|uniref:hypothetical protein n=1 Tax=uncultured Hydrogenophaga sp. TaxID=199683 RepID=UPI003747D52E
MEKLTFLAATRRPGLYVTQKQVCARAAAMAAALLLVICVDCAVYLALSGEPAAWETLLLRAPGWVCAQWRACSA